MILIISVAKIIVTVVIFINFDKTPGGKDRWEQYKDAVCCFEQNLEEAPYITAALRPLTFHLTKSSR